MKHALKNTILWMIGGMIYILIELLFRGYSHWTMFILGGLCFVSVGLINRWFSWKTPMWKQSLLGAIIITTLEFITGCVVNLWLGWNVWDYTNLPFHLLGQICLPYFILWVGASTIAIVLDDWLRYWLFGEKKPKYVLF